MAFNEPDEDIFITYDKSSENIAADENAFLNREKNISRRSGRILEEDGISFLETAEKITSMNIEYQSTPLKQAEEDEFDLLDKTYVPLDVRLGDENKIKKSVRSRLSDEFERNSRFSMGIESLLNGTD